MKIEKMPVLFLAHGSPMNAIATNSYTHAMNKLGQNLPKPKAILCISAHWHTSGTWVTSMNDPKTIHDFYGFPDELFQVQYPAKGSPEVAKEIKKIVTDPEVSFDDAEWGLDHGTWSVLRHLYPQADVPVLQLSLDLSKPPEYHFKIGEQLKDLRSKGILIIGSGNIVHNLRKIKWEEDAPAFDWAIEFDGWIKNKLLARDYESLIHNFKLSEAGKLSVPTPDHYYPLLYIIGAASNEDVLKFEYEEMQNGSISMLSFSFN